ncbi:MAG: ATP phosphoribosyltransferase regulatory subunit [Lachnospiraceae bacterium]|nr:ATP phosphoribosyltransferase regulatory subunit [Lachnospiraceae bacterium]
MEERLHRIFGTYGFDDIQTPTFEFMDVFSEERGTVSTKNMYKFFDRDGNILVLRPDMTPQIARCVAGYFRDLDQPLRLCYSGNTFVNMTDYQGKLRECTQIGAELVGDDSIQADAEMLALTVSALLEAGFDEFQVDVGHTGFFRAIVTEAGFDADDIMTLRSLIDNKNAFGIESFLRGINADEKLVKLFGSLPSMFGGREKLEEIRTLTSNSEAIAAIDRIEKIFDLMKAYGFERYISFDLGTLSQYDYYTGIIFHAYTYGTGEPVISGGRYDSLIGQFGVDTPAIGMAIYVDSLMAALSRQKRGLCPEACKTLLLYREKDDMKALAYAKKLRDEGGQVATMCVPDSESMEEAEQRIDRAGFSGIVRFR